MSKPDEDADPGTRAADEPISFYCAAIFAAIDAGVIGPDRTGAVEVEHEPGCPAEERQVRCECAATVRIISGGEVITLNHTGAVQGREKVQ